MKLDELLRRHDVCFFCGYTIGIAGQTTCPECGKGRPTAEEIGRVRTAIKVGKAGVACLGATLAWLAFLVLLATLDTNVAFAVLFLVLFGVFIAFMAGMVSTWVYEARRSRLLLRSAWRRAFVAGYPWVLTSGVLVLLVAGWS